MYFAALAGLLSICGVPLAIAFGVVFVGWLIYVALVRTGSPEDTQHIPDLKAVAPTRPTHMNTPTSTSADTRGPSQVEVADVAAIRPLPQTTEKERFANAVLQAQIRSARGRKDKIVAVRLLREEYPHLGLAEAVAYIDGRSKP